MARGQKLRSNFKPNLSLEVLREWRLKEEDGSVVGKLEKECELIKQ